MVYLVTGATNDGWEHCTGCVIAGEPSLHQAGAVIAHQSSSLFVVAHGVSSETRVRARTQAKPPLVRVMRFPVCLYWLIETTDTHERTAHTMLPFADQQHGLVVSSAAVIL